MLIMLVPNCSERWRLEKVRFTSFVCGIVLSRVPLTFLQSQFINIGSLGYVIS